MAELGVHSEVGKLRTVMVCRPSLAHERLTPGNCHDLLFDDVIWVHEAQKDHYDFTLKMKERGVEVLELHDLLAETLDDPIARKFVLDRRITDNALGIQNAALVRPWLNELESAQLAAFLIGGIAISDLPDATTKRLLSDAFGVTDFVLPPIPNTLFQRDPSCWIYNGVTCNPMFWPARRPETLLAASHLQVSSAISRVENSRSGGATPIRISRTPLWKAEMSCRLAKASSSSAWASAPPTKRWVRLRVSSSRIKPRRE